MNIRAKLTLLAVGLVTSAPACASIIAGSLTGGSAMAGGGMFQITTPPPVVGQDNFNNDNVRAFYEQQNYKLTSALTLDSGGSIASGTLINSYYVNFDPLAAESVSGLITFSSTILGIIDSTSSLKSSDYLGSSNTIYKNPQLRGFESVDSATFAGTVLTFDLRALSPGDSFRVITVSDTGSVPEPTTWAMMIAGFGLVGAGMRRRSGRMIQAI